MDIKIKVEQQKSLSRSSYEPVRIGIVIDNEEKLYIPFDAKDLEIYNGRAFDFFNNVFFEVDNVTIRTDGVLRKLIQVQDDIIESYGREIEKLISTREKLYSYLPQAVWEERDPL